MGTWHIRKFSSSKPSGRYRIHAVTVNDTIYLIGGATDIYHPLADEFITGTTDPDWRWQNTAEESGGKIYSIGGDYSGTLVSNVNEYDPATDSWTQKTTLPTPRKLLMSFQINGFIHVVGGMDGNNTYLTVHEIYDPSTNTWSSGTPLPTARAEGQGESIGGRGYVVGGSTSQGNSALLERYDPDTGTWTTLANMPTARRICMSFTLNNKLYVAGGDNDTVDTALRTVEVYDPSTGTWSTETSMPCPRSFGGGTAALGRGYIIFGWEGTAGRDGSILEFVPDFTTLSGTVYDENGNPAGGITVVAWAQWLPSSTLCYTTSGTDGSFSIDVPGSAVSGWDKMVVLAWPDTDGVPGSIRVNI